METTGRLREGLPSLLLVWSMLLVASMAVLQADLIDGLHILPIVATLALVAGHVDVILLRSRLDLRAVDEIG